MASIKVLRDRIASIKATQKITKAMQLVAASKLRYAQEAILDALPFSKKILQILFQVKSDLNSENHRFFSIKPGIEKVHLIIVCSSERGLCGGFNTQIIRLAREFVCLLLAEKKSVKIITIGEKGFDLLKRDFEKLIINHFNLPTTKKISFSFVREISDKILNDFDHGNFNYCTLFYSQFKSVLFQNPTSKKIFPIDFNKKNNENFKFSYCCEYEPLNNIILDELLIKNFSMQIFCALLENFASEMGAKMTAMDNATRNAETMIKKLSILYNRQRQSKITTELVEIIAGANAI